MFCSCFLICASVLGEAGYVSVGVRCTCVWPWVSDTRTHNQNNLNTCCTYNNESATACVYVSCACVHVCERDGVCA